MHRKNVVGNFASALLLMSVSLGMVTDASANQKILDKAKALKILPAGASCTSCHTAAPTLKASYKVAYTADKAGLTGLRNLIKGCPSGQTLDKIKYVCQVAKAGTVGLAGSGLAKTDVYAVTCGAGTAALWVSANDLAPVKLPLVSIQAKKGTGASAMSADTGVDGNAIYSPWVKVAGAAGAFTVNVNKSAYTGTVAANKGAESYSARFSCRKADGTPVATTPLIKQNN
jgi:hypothetical protein